MKRLSINRYLDHAVLKPELDQKQTIEAIESGLEYEVRTVCVRPADIKTAQDICKGSNTEVSCVLSFPHGVALSASKADEASRYVQLGVSEIDMEANYGLICSGQWDRVRADIEAVSKVAKPANVLLKVILETAALDLDQIVRATQIAVQAKADFVKTSTGFAWDGASEEAVQTMLETANGRIGVKASGGIRDRQRAELFVDMGCARLGVGFTSTPIICAGSGADSKDSSQGY